MYAVIKRNASYCYDNCITSWTDCGVHNNSTQSEINNTAHAERSGFSCNSFSDWAIGFGQVILPVELISFDAVMNANNAILTWTTLSEYNTDYFAVERSTDGVHYNQVGIVGSSGNATSASNYFFTDYAINELAVNIVYYRLRVVAFDHTFSYSDVRLLNVNGTSSSDFIAIYPNPFLDEIQVLWNSPTEGTSTFQMTDVTGRILIEKQIAVSQGSNHLLLHDFSVLNAGVYFLSIISGKEILTEKVLKEN
jgi:hypothetical protein